MSSLSPTDTILTASFAAGFCNFSASSIDAFIPVCRWVCGHDRAKVDAKELDKTNRDAVQEIAARVLAQLHSVVNAGRFSGSGSALALDGLCQSPKWKWTLSNR